MKGLYNQMKTIVESSEQLVYLYLDDNHKACNSRLATLLGCNSSKGWADIEGFLEPYVAEKSQGTVSSTYWDATKKMKASTI